MKTRFAARPGTGLDKEGVVAEVAAMSGAVGPMKVLVIGGVGIEDG